LDGGKGYMKKRNIYLMLFFAIATFGLYFFYWSTLIQADLKKNHNVGFTCLKHVIFSIMTLGFYIAIWVDKMFWEIEYISKKERSILYEVASTAPTVRGSSGVLMYPYILQIQINEYLENKESVEQLKHVEKVEEEAL